VYTVDLLELEHGEAVRDRVQACAAVALKWRAQKAHAREFGDQLARERAVFIVLGNAGQEPAAGELCGVLPDEMLLFAE